MWNVPEGVTLLLKYFTVEIKDNPEVKKRKNSEYNIEDIKKIELFLNNNKIKILSDILKGRGGLSAEYMIVSEYDIDGGIRHNIIGITDV